MCSFLANAMCMLYNCDFTINLRILHSLCEYFSPNFRNLYTGFLLSRLHKVFPSATTLASLSREIFGSVGELTAYVVLYSNIFLLLGNNLIIMARCIQEIFYSTTVCRPWAGALACCLIFFSNQIRDLHKISFLSIIRFKIRWECSY